MTELIMGDVFASYPWDECIADAMKEYGDMETAKKVCGSIRAKYGHSSPTDLPSSLTRKGALAEAYAKLSARRDTTFLLDNFIATRPGDPYRLFPFGRIVKNGKSHTITPDYARRFKLPHFKPPIKLGSHEDTTPAGGHIVRLEVREDGLYAWPEMTDKGASALNAGDYRYQSPEVIWDDGALEDPLTGEMMVGPMIVGDALLHTPHLGEAAALYSIEPLQTGGANMGDQVTIPASLWNRVEEFLASVFSAKPMTGAAPAPTSATPAPDPREAEAAKVKAALAAEQERFAAELKTRDKERDELRAQLDATKLEAERKARVDKFTADLAPTKYAANSEVAALLAGMTDAQAGKVLEMLKALSAQINEAALTGEHGSTGAGADNPEATFNAAIAAKMQEKHLNYADAYAVIKVENKDVFTAWAEFRKQQAKK